MLNAILDASFIPAERLWRTVAKQALFICGGAIMLWIAHQGTRRNLAPPDWVVLVVVLLQMLAGLL